jgi:hypothetical protein
MYESPKQIRRRQQTRNEAPRRRERQPRALKTLTDTKWNAACEFHIGRILAQAEAGHCEAAGRHAEALVHMAVTRRALEIMRKERRDYYSAMDTAKEELYNCERRKQC